MLKISIVKVESPACLWGHVGRGTGREAETTESYNKLLAQMNLFYNDVTQDVQKTRPSSFEEGQVCVVYWEVVKSWCRAVVESIIMDSVSRKVRCLLVDHGERLVISSDQIRIAMQKFFELPFWVRKFHLAGIKPITLRVSVYERMAELMPSGQWDSSATLYLHSLLQGSTGTEAVLVEREFDSTSIELYLTIDNIKVSVNDDLVTKKFAYYSRKSADGDGGILADRYPLMLGSNTLTQTNSSTSELTKQTHMPQAMPKAAAASGALEWPLVSSRPVVQFCSQLQELQELVDPEEDWRPEVTQSESPEEVDWSLAAAVKENLGLFRFRKFVNSDVSSQQQPDCTDCQNEDLSYCQPQEAPSASQNCTEAELCESVETALTGTREKSKEEWLCSQLLEWFNPKPLNSDTDDATENVLPPSDPTNNEILVHSAFPMESCPCLDEAPLTDTLRSVMLKKRYKALSPADCYSWTAVAQGINTLIISNTANEPLSYLPPLLSHIQLNSIVASLPSSSGPITVLLCWGWEKAQAVYDLLEERGVSRDLHPVIMLLGIGKDEAKAVTIPKNCLLVVTTPFTLVRLLSTHCFFFLRLCHLVLDEADKLFTLAPEQMETILQHFQKVTSSEEKVSCPQQLVAVAKKWTLHMEGLVSKHMPSPCVVITLPEEAALYGNVQQIIHMTLESSKISVLLSVLDFNPAVAQKTLIVANSMQDVENVFKAVSNKSTFCLKMHGGLTHDFTFVAQQWRKQIGPGTHVVLVTTNECLKCLGIRDATCVIHYSFPTSPKLFGRRLFCMADNFRNLSQGHIEVRRPHVTRSVLLISERNARHVVGVMRYLDRTNTPLPLELQSFVRGVHIAREAQKEGRPLCNYLKSFGVCRDSSVCPDRHRFNPHLDQSHLPASGVIEVVPLYIRTASVFSGRIVGREDREFDMLSAEMASFYTDKKPGAQELLIGGLYTVQEEDVFHRVKILSLSDRGDRLFCSVFVYFMDVGKEEEVKSHQILHLPHHFQSLPGQAVELIVCRVKPVDAEANWHPKVTRLVSQKIRGVQYKARAVLSLGNTVFLDPMVLVTKVPGLKTFINEYSVQSTILNSGMGVSNPEHVELLRALCQEGMDGCGTEATHMSEWGDSLPSLEVHTEAKEQSVVKALSAAMVRKLAGPDSTHLMHSEPPSPLPSANLSPIQASPTPELHLVPACEMKSQLISQTDCEMKTTHSTQYTDSLHPQVRWYDTGHSAIVTVKLQNAETQSCCFYSDRVVYSGRLSGRLYRANLELHRNIMADCCRWEMKANEPVLKLVKQQQGSWERLVRNKNIFVSYDMDHFNEEEDTAPDGPCFMENTGETHCYVDSGTDSD